MRDRSLVGSAHPIETTSSALKGSGQMDHRRVPQHRRAGGATRQMSVQTHNKQFASTCSRMSIHLLASVCCSSLAVAQTARVAFEDSVAVYGPEIFPALTQLRLCGNFRVLVAYVNGTDLLFVDEVAPI